MAGYSSGVQLGVSTTAGTAYPQREPFPGLHILDWEKISIVIFELSYYCLFATSFFITVSVSC